MRTKEVRCQVVQTAGAPVVSRDGTSRVWPVQHRVCVVGRGPAVFGLGCGEEGLRGGRGGQWPETGRRTARGGLCCRRQSRARFAACMLEERGATRHCRPVCPGKLHFVKFESSKIEECMDFIEAKCLHRVNGGAEVMRVKATGGGAYKYADVRGGAWWGLGRACRGLARRGQATLRPALELMGRPTLGNRAEPRSPSCKLAWLFASSSAAFQGAAGPDPGAGGRDELPGGWLQLPPQSR